MADIMNESIFRAFHELHYPKMMAIASRFVRSTIAKDMVQEAFIAYWNNKDKMTIDDAPSYIVRCVQNNCLNHIKHNKVVADYEVRVRIAESRINYMNEQNATLYNLNSKDIHQIVEKSLNKLPPKCKEAFRLCFFHELTYKEVAQVMNISHRTVEVHVQKAIAFLRSELSSSPHFFMLNCIFYHFFKF